MQDFTCKTGTALKDALRENMDLHALLYKYLIYDLKFPDGVKIKPR